MSAVMLTPRALYEEVAELLRQRIFASELEPGSWIDEMRLAEEYGISRTPLREALKVLAAEGLVTMKVRRGAYVTEVSEKDLSDVYHLLSLLESDAAGVVATIATDAELAELHTLHAELEGMGKRALFGELLAARDRSGRQVAVAYVFHAFPVLREAAAFVRADPFGPVLQAVVTAGAFLLDAAGRDHFYASIDQSCNHTPFTVAKMILAIFFKN